MRKQLQFFFAYRYIDHKSFKWQNKRRILKLWKVIKRMRPLERMSCQWEMSGGGNDPGVLSATQICPYTLRCRVTKPILPIRDGGVGGFLFLLKLCQIPSLLTQNREFGKSLWTYLAKVENSHHSSLLGLVKGWWLPPPYQALHRYLRSWFLIWVKLCISPKLSLPKRYVYLTKIVSPSKDMLRS